MFDWLKRNKKGEERRAGEDRRKKGWRDWLHILLKTILWLILPVILASLLFGYGLYWLDKQTGVVSKLLLIPDVEKIVNHEFAQKTWITDVHGERIGCFVDEDREWKKTSEVSPFLPIAVMASEDRNFPMETDNLAEKALDLIFRPGYDLRGISRAAWRDLLEMRFAQGGSTIYQQVIKNTTNDKEKSIMRKVREIVLAVKLKHRLSPDDVLEIYMNMVYIGGPYGFESAFQGYLHKSARDASLDEAALFAGVINRSSPLNEFFSKDPEVVKGARAELLERRSRVLRYMHDKSYVTEGQFRAAMSKPIKLFPYRGACKNLEPYVRAEIFRRYSMGKKWHLTTMGGTIQTTLDMKKQRALDEACREEKEDYLKHHSENAQTFQCAAMAVEIATGNIQAMIGGQDFGKNQYNLTTQDPRPAGSSFKPIVYAALLEQKYNEEIARRTAYLLGLPGEERVAAAAALPPIDLLKDCKVNDTQGLRVPATVGNRDNVVSWFSPHNYPMEYKGAHIYAGWVDCVDAVAESRNTAAVSILWELSKDAPPAPAPGMTEKIWERIQTKNNGVPTIPARWRYGIATASEMAHRLGIKSKLQEFSTLPLGFNEVTLEEMMQSYETIVNGGCARPLVFVMQIVDAKGNILEKRPELGTCKPVLAPEVAAGVRILLQGVIDHPHGTGKSIRKEFPQGAICGKTGTATSPDRSSPIENWFIGCTPKELIGARVDNAYDSVNGYAELGHKETGGKNGTKVWKLYCKKVNCLDSEEKFPELLSSRPALPISGPVADPSLREENDNNSQNDEESEGAVQHELIPAEPKEHSTPSSEKPET